MPHPNDRPSPQPVPMADVVARLDPIFVSMQDAARMLNLSRAEVFTLCRDERIEARFHGKRRLIVLASVRAFAESLPSSRPE